MSGFIGSLFGVPDGLEGNPLQLSFRADEPRKLLIGKTAHAGAFAFSGLSGNDDRNLHRITILAGHKCNAMPRVWADGTLLSARNFQHGVRTEISEYRDGSRHRMWLTWYDGRPNTPADPHLLGENITPRALRTTDTYDGLSYVVMTARFDDDSLTSIPEFVYEIEGADLYDRRLDSTSGGNGPHRRNDPSTWAYTDNVAVALDHYQLGMVGGENNDKLIFGMGFSDWQVPYEDFEAAADLCDEVVLGQSRYAANGILSAEDDHRTNVDKLSKAMAAIPYDVGGRLSIRPAQARPVVLTIYDRDLVDTSGSSLSTTPSGSDLVNTVRGTYRDPNTRHNTIDYPTAKDDALISKDGREFEHTLDLDLETSVARAQRLSSIELERQRRRDRLSEVYMPFANELQVGDWFRRVSTLHGPSDKVFEVEVKRTNSDLTVDVEARETDPDIVAFGINQLVDVSQPEPLAPLLPRQAVAPPATGAGGSESGGGATLPDGVITIDSAPEEELDRFDYFDVEYGIAEGTGAALSISEMTRQMTSFSNEDGLGLHLTGLLPDTRYAWRIRGVSRERFSEWSGYSQFTTPADLISTNTLSVGGVTAEQLLSEIAAATQAHIDAAQERAAEAQARIDGDAAEAEARAADLIAEASARGEAIGAVDTRLTAVIAGFLGSEGSAGVAQNFADLSIWSRSISATDKDRFLALFASEALTVDGVPSYATTAGRILSLTLAKPCEGGQSIPVRARIKVLSDGTSSGGNVLFAAYYWNAEGNVRVGFEALSNEKYTVADGVVTLDATLTTHANAAWYSPYVLLNSLAGDNAHIAMLDLLDGDAGGEPSVEGSVQAAIAQEAEARADADGALATEIATVKATADGAATSAQLTALSEASADADGALATSIMSVGATASSANARSLATETALASESSANAERFETLEATLDALAATPLNENENFSDWPAATGLPSNWTAFGGATFERREEAGQTGDYTIRSSASAATFGGFQQTVTGLENETYTVRIRLKGANSNLGQCAVWAQTLNAAGVVLLTSSWVLEQHADVDGVISDAAPNGEWREWSFTIDMTGLAAPDNCLFRFYNHLSGSGPANSLDVDSFEIAREIGDSAEVNFLRTALSDAAGNFARLILNTAAGAARAFLEVGSVQRSDGTVDSNVGIGARRFEVSNPVNGVWLKALEIANGVVTVFGDLNALGAMRFGTRRIAVALQSFRISNLADGDAVNFGGDLTNIPDYEFFTSGLDPLLAGEEYDLTLTSLTPTGGVVRAKIIGGGSPASYRDEGSTSGSGSEPDEVLHKGNAADATNGDYTFAMNIQATYAGQNGEGFSASGQLEFFVRSAGVWISLGTEAWSNSRASGGSFSSESVQYVKNFSGPIGQTSDQEYGVSIITGNGGSITNINSFTVAYSNTAASTTRTATPSGRKATLKVIPRNG